MLIKSYILLEMNLIGSKWTWYFTWTSSQKVPNNFIQFVFFIILLCQPCKIKFPVKLNKTCPSVQTFSFTKFTFMAVVASSFKWVLSVSPWTYHLFYTIITCIFVRLMSCQLFQFVVYVKDLIFGTLWIWYF